MYVQVAMSHKAGRSHLWVINKLLTQEKKQVLSGDMIRFFFVGDNGVFEAKRNKGIQAVGAA